MNQPASDEPPNSPRPIRPAEDVLERPAIELAAPLIYAGAAGGDAPTAGTELGRYQIVREIGRGGMATVFLAHDRQHDRVVALKVVHLELGHALGSERFLREIQLAARLQHPHILPLFDSGETGGRLWYTMPYVAGESLRERLRREAQLPVEEAIRIGREVADALGAAHAAGVIHRDIKPENILLSPAGPLSEGHALVADFGVARSIEAAGADTLTGAGLVLGTPAYMSPEQASGDPNIDGRTDLYSLGCVLYEMLAGEPPFTGPTAQAVVAKRMTGRVPRVRAVRPTVPESVDEAVAQALAPLAADRFQSARALADALGPSPAGIPVHPQWIWRRRWIAGVAAIIGAAALAVVLRDRRTEPMLDPTAATMAVVPFGPAVPDSGLTRLGRELVITLSATLDGVGGIRVVDALTILGRAERAKGKHSLDEAIRLARQLNSASVVHGTLVRTAAGVRLDLGLYATADLTPMARATVTADPGDLSSFTDSVVFALLRQIWRNGTPPSPSLAAVTTHSIPALRAFLDGEQAMAQNNFFRAATDFAHAIEADSTFWLAYWRYQYARSWHGEPVDSAIHAAYWTHRARLPERDRLLIEASETGTAKATLTSLRAATARYPDYWPGWLLYQDNLVHLAPYLGTTLGDARAALERLTALSPDFVPAWSHLLLVAIAQRDTAASSRAVGQMVRLRFDSIAAQQPLDLFLYFSYLDHLARSGGTPDSTMAERAARLITAFAGPLPAEVLGGSLSVHGFHRAQLDLDRRVLRHAPGARKAAASHRGMAIAWAARGAWDSALVEAGRYADLTSDSGAGLFGYELASVGSWLGVVDSETVSRWREMESRAGAQPDAEQRAELAWLDGLVAVARQDGPGLRQAREVLRQAGVSSGAFLDRSLAAFDLRLAGRRQAAAKAMAELERELADRFGPSGAGVAHPFLDGVDRLAAGGWLREQGETATAVSLLNWCDAILVERLFSIAHANRILTPLANFERARIEGAEGKQAVAREHFQRFVEEYDLPPEAHRWMVQTAEDAMSSAREP